MKLFLALIVALSLSGCDKAYLPQSSPEYTNYGGGVLFFPYTKDRFGRALADFLKQNPSYRVVAVAPDDTALYGETQGYFVVVDQPCCPTLLKRDLQ